MKHIVLFKFATVIEKDNLSSIVDGVYSRLKDEFKVIEGYEYRFNYLENLEQNMDFILFVDLKDEHSLPSYINHPVHVDFVNKLKSMELISKSAIDIK